MRSPRIRIAAALAALTQAALVQTVPGLIGSALAESVPRVLPSYGAYAPRGHGDAYGYGGPLLRGDYVGAPLTRVPSPDRLVPSPWSYGTYGVPTVSGIPGAPAGRPTLTVIEAGGRAAPSRRDRAWASDEAPGGLRVIEVRVPRR